MTKPKFGADPGRRAKFRDALSCTLDCMRKDDIVSPDEAVAYASRSDEDLALLLLARALSVIVDLGQKVEAAKETIREADRVLELVQQQAEAEEKMEKTA